MLGRRTCTHSHCFPWSWQLGIAAKAGWRSRINAFETFFGQTIGSGAGAVANAAVPEPATLAMLLVGVLATYARRRTLVS